MGLVWSIVNNIQLITHLPLFKIIFPSNAAFVLEIFIELTNFELIPANDILKKIFTFLEDVSSDSETDEEGEMLGYSLDYFVENTA